ncbi:hypothetical protein MGYG_05700 [Nannizzia gypsea CBS 118893]|uniref:RBR-type E3 ubiquitin transferase n=1 Tax=Arthroderma gypseum (strain ATCC MYA-4604 / CBS 118893) TaxID=535722 RepID=E4UXB5_ARTGP|nr:hypothetical protein MGYG_05700 [Nannizzia gypsea CBS 118893]EFR02702.1 hypothetical protein MGYG_05700 [Nannizzia gypsea CBS 118893]
MENDLLILVDATWSMRDYFKTLKMALPRIISVSALTGCFSRIGLLAYRDYSEAHMLEWSGWLDVYGGPDADGHDILAFANSLEVEGDRVFNPEAAKTALARAYELMRVDAKTILLLYTDSFPHFGVSEAHKWMDTYIVTETGVLEREALSDPSSYSGYGPAFVDWVSATKLLSEGEKAVQVFSLLSSDICWREAAYYIYLSTLTGGACVVVQEPSAEEMSAASESGSDDDSDATIDYGPCPEYLDICARVIFKVTVDLLLTWMGIKPAENATTEDSAAEESDVRISIQGNSAILGYYESVVDIKTLNHELDPRAGRFFVIDLDNFMAHDADYMPNVVTVLLTPDNTQKYIRKKDEPVTNFAMAWATNPAYRSMALQHLKNIIKADVRAIAVNPALGSLWRRICSDRTCDSRQELLDAFSAEAGKLESARSRDRLKIWLESSYDYTEEVLELINSVPNEEQFPCVYLDPTLDFTPSSAEAEDDEFGKPITALTRVNLLEIGRSCDPSVLRRHGRMLTQLTYVDRAADLPEHIVNSTNEEVPRIPMVLARDEYKRQFWRILLHLVVPGTKLSARAAALLAALSLRLGITPLIEVAEWEALGFRDKWNDLETSETWSIPCLNLLINADDAYNKRRADLEGEIEDTDLAKAKPATLLKPSDRELFEKLIAYRMLEVNLDSALIAKVGWTPEKTIAPLGPTAICRSCEYPRSVSVMNNNGECGICICAAQDDAWKKVLDVGVSREDSPESPAIWVECCVQTCRAQYVVYNVTSLNGRAKCHYCRLQSATLSKSRQICPDAPWIECIKCLNRFIWPVEYRPFSLSTSKFTCIHCDAGRKTVVEIETTARKISEENSFSWLVCDNQNPELCPFTGRSLLTTISKFGTENFTSRMTIFPVTNKTLTLKGKTIQNVSEVISTLQDLVSRLKTIKEDCSLCMSVFRPDMLNAACGRRGCLQRVCRDCLNHWYGLNAAGRILNIGALFCPFCRRPPSAKTLARYAMGVQAVTNLSKAVEEQGTWIYAWCISCSSARQFMERECARGTPPEVSRWHCPECVEQREEQKMAKRISKIKPCPGCGVMTEKVFGCAHITCPVPECQAEWCYICGERAVNIDIYEHLNNAHGGIFDHYD